MSYGVRKQKVRVREVPEEYIFSCCKCGMQFILYGVLIGEDNYPHAIKQMKLYYCPYCGYKHDKKNI